MVAVCSPIYYDPGHRWCGLEWAAMDGLSQQRLPNEVFGTIIPLVFRETSPLPAVSARVQYVDISGASLVGRGYYTRKEFREKIRGVVKQIEVVAEALSKCQVETDCDGFNFPTESAFGSYLPPVPPAPFRSLSLTNSTTTTTPGTVITFYSYKGGTGRTMALANIGCLLAEASPSPGRRRVLLMDWDLEAPGLHRFFPKQCEQPENLLRPGVIDYFTLLKEVLTACPDQLTVLSCDDNLRELLGTKARLDQFIVRDVVPGLDVMKAGTLGKDYAEQAGQFNWYDFYRKFNSALPAVRDQLCESYDYVLIDSRPASPTLAGSAR